MQIKLDKLTHTYMKGGPFESDALKEITFTIEEGEFVGIIGHTGSGKSTLVQHFNGLLKPTSGSIFVGGEDLQDKNTTLSKIRQRVGLVFQYPEYQLFEETVAKDVAFGPKNLKLTEEEVEQRVKKALKMVGLDYDTVKDESPFDLSGGQKRRVAMAGILAMEPKVLVLDEPTAGLDPVGRNEILNEIKKIHQEFGLTVIIVSHDMENIAKLVHRVIVMDGGEVKMMGTPRTVFQRAKELEAIGLGIPEATSLMHDLKDRGFDISLDVLTVEEAIEALLRTFHRNKEGV